MMRLVFDLETDGLLHEVTKIHCIAATDIDTGGSYLFTYEDIEEGVQLLRDADVIIGHNIIKYDIQVLHKLYGFTKNVNQIEDTLILSYLLYPDIGLLDTTRYRYVIPQKFINKHSLDAWGYRLKLHKHSFNGPWKKYNPLMPERCKQDVKINIALWEELNKRRHNLSNKSIRIEYEFARLIGLQEQRGVWFDHEAALRLLDKLLVAQKTFEERLQRIFPPKEVVEEFLPKRDNKTLGYKKGVVFYKHKSIPFNPNSRKQIVERIKEAHPDWRPTKFTDTTKETANPVPSVDEDSLRELDYPEAKELITYLTIKKRLGQIRTGKNAWLTLYNTKTHCIHGTVNTAKTYTGRASHSKPNLSQVPSLVNKHGPVLYGKACRKLFKPRPGFILLGVDASGIEMRNLAHFMFKYDKGEFVDVILHHDIHSFIQAKIHADTRDKSKTFEYAYIYGAGNHKLGITFGVSAATAYTVGGQKRKLLEKELPALKSVQDSIKSELERKGYLLGIDGRHLLCKKAYSALNTKLQSAAAIEVKLATILAHKYLLQAGYKYGKDFAMVLHSHDEFQLEISRKLIKQIDEIGNLCVQAFKDAGKYFKLNCPLDAEYKEGTNWAETH